MTPTPWIETAGARLLTTDEAARLLGVTVATLHAWMRAGRLTAIQPGRAVLLDRRDVERLVAERRKG
jgi:excisionase family DNA binding protein